MLRGDEKHVEVEGTLKKRTAKAALIETEHGEGWVARSCIHFLTDKAIDEAEIGDAMQFKIMEWVAKERGFV